MKIPNYDSTNQYLTQYTKKSMDFVIFIFSMAFILILTLFFMEETDTWMFLKTGEVILKSHFIPVKDIFSFTVNGDKWINHEWLFSVIIYFFYMLSGIKGLAIFKSLILLSTGFFIYRSLFLVTKSSLMSGVFLIFSFYICFIRFVVRPQIITFLFISIFIYILLLYKYKKRNYLFFLPFIMVFWANIHGAFIIGFALTGIFLIDSFVIGIVKKDDASKKRFLMLLLFGIILGIAPVINPSTYNIYIYPFFQATDKSLLTSVAEWYPPFSNFFEGALEITLYKIWIVFSLISFIFAFRKNSIPGILLFLFFFPLSLTAIRQIQVAVFCTLFVIARNYRASFYYLKKIAKSIIINIKFKELLKYQKNLIFGLWIGVRALFIALIFFLGFQLLFFGIVLMKKENGKTSYVSLQHKARPEYPEKIADYIIANDIKGNMLNTYDNGDYLLFRLYPKKLVFIDSRGNTVYPPEFLNEFFKIYTDKESFIKILDKYSITCVVWEYPGTGKGDTKFNVNRYLRESKEWSLVFFDDNDLVYLKNIPENENIIKKDHYSLINPALFNPKEYFGPEISSKYINECIDEYKKSLIINPESSMAYSQLGFFYYRLGLYKESLESNEKCLKLNQNNVDVLYNLGMLYIETSYFDKAITVIKRAISINSLVVDYYNGLGTAFLNKTMNKDAITAFKKAINLDKRNSSSITHRNLGYAYLKNGDIKNGFIELKKYCIMSPDDIATANDLGANLANQGMLSDALSVWENILKIKTDYKEVIENINKAKGMMKN
jgi:tetratricopeptide (TPR) repeat protein